MGYEWRLRYGQAQDALHDLRQHILWRSHLYQFKRRNVHGQIANTRAQAMISSVERKINNDKVQYRMAYKALLALQTMSDRPNWQNELYPLKDEDVSGVSEGTDSGQSEGRRKLSWIWTASGVHATTEKGMQEGK